ncbi:hypothetical protein EDC44_104131 [Cricetibacter osteomyelitidis]|uniref:PRD domain-containing protein n=1 Tax=Cricetibacter osteomyelitidis TaxID=1521931 RepID=A0A4R2T3L5_9PAST|nr:hypothetical protein [Cricetibacter osteomyelitidis]TCP96595.1 hypothetical protein EDC44_104131 [Cricetibacter osteomyelitidis]
MKVFQRLQLLQARQLINQNIQDTVIHIMQYLVEKYGVDVDCPQVEILLIHLANALGRISRQGCAQPLNHLIYAEIQNSLIFPKVMRIHLALLDKIPFEVPYNEQTHMIANLYSLALSQPKILTAAE